MAYSQEYVCSNCGKDVSLNDDFCPHCGEDIRKVEEDYICTNCGGEVSEDDTICPFCREDVKEVDNTEVLEWRKRTSIFSLEPTLSRDGAWILTITGWILLINGALAFICIAFFGQLILSTSSNPLYRYLRVDSPVQLTSGLVLLVLGFFARRGVVFYLYFGLGLFILNGVRYAAKIIDLSLYPGLHPSWHSITALYLLPVVFFAWLLIKSLPAYRKWYGENKQNLNKKIRRRNLINKLRGRIEDFE
jgi:DNA-directed RNA polymerase subunit RPC12/RpoP